MNQRRAKMSKTCKFEKEFQSMTKEDIDAMMDAWHFREGDEQ